MSYVVPESEKYIIPKPGTYPETPTPTIKTLKVELLVQNGQYVVIEPNSRTATPFETDLFKGLATIIIRTDPIDPFVKGFFTGKRMFEVQLQGQFKSIPKGEMYVGAQISKPLNLSLAMRSFANLTLRFLNTLVSDLHVSYGDKQEGNPNYELAHMVAPLFSSFDKVIITPKGETPPPLFIPFYEDATIRKKRCRYRSMKDHVIDLDAIYSLSVNTGNMDLTQWKIVNIPLARPTSMTNFFGSSSMELCGYELPPSSIEMFGRKKHPHAHLKQIFGMRLIPMAPDQFVPLSEREPCNTNSAPSNLSCPSFDEDTEVEDLIDPAECSDYDSEDEKCLQNRQLLSNRKKKMNWFRRTIEKIKKRDTFLPSTHRRKDDSDTDESTDDSEDDFFADFNYSFIANTDLNYCPAVFEINYPKKRNKRTHCFALMASNNTMRLRSYWEVKKNIDLLPLKSIKTPLHSSQCEILRHQICQTFHSIRHDLSTLSSSSSHGSPNPNPLVSSTTVTSLNNFLSPKNLLDLSFLTANTIVNTKDKSKPVCEGFISLALSRRYFTEQFAQLTSQSLILKSRRNSNNNNYTILLSDIITVQLVDDNEVPFPGYSFFCIETVHRLYLFLTLNQVHSTLWIESFTHLIGNNIIISPLSSREDYNNLIKTRRRSDYTLNSEFSIITIPSYRVNKENILNYRRIQFKEGRIGNTMLARNSKSQQKLLRLHQNVSILKPNQLMEKILTILLNFSSLVINNQIIPEYDFIQFNDLITLLQVVDIFTLTDCEKLSFFLNLYHTMQIHGNILLKFPKNDHRNYWPMFFNEVCYIVGFQILSIAEVEHNILRLHMNYASPYANITRPLTKSKKRNMKLQHFAISSRDFRLHFAINCGASTNIPYTMVYTPDNLDDQLDFIVKKDLETRFIIDESSRTISMPYLPFADFISYKTKLLPNTLPGAYYHESSVDSLSKHVNKASSNHTYTSTSYLVEVLLILLPYLSHSKQSSLTHLLKDPSNIEVEFTPIKLEDFRLLQKIESVV